MPVLVVCGSNAMRSNPAGTPRGLDLAVVAAPHRGARNPKL